MISHRIRTELVIEAPPSEVWAVLSDTEAWPSWNDALLELSGDKVVGLRQELHLVALGLHLRSTVRLAAFEEGRELAWAGGPRFLFHGHHGLRLEPVGEHTRLVHFEEFRGVFVPFAGLMLRRLPAAYQAINVALRAEVLRRRGGRLQDGAARTGSV